MTEAENALTYLKRYLKDDHIALYYLTIIEIERFCADDKRE